MATVKGDLASIGVPEIFRAIASEDRSGQLSLTRDGSQAYIYFRDGDAYHARLVGSGVRLGERLVSAGLLTHEELMETLELQKTDDRSRRLGELLVERGLADIADITTIVRQQIEDTIFEILRWEGGRFEFEPDQASDEDIGLLVSVENLVMEGARRFREWHQITRKIPSMDAIPRLNDEEDTGIEVALTPEEWALISRVNGRTTVAELARSCGFTDLEAGRTVFGLVTTGVLKITLPDGVEAPGDDPALEAMFDELEEALRESARDRSSEGVTHPTLEELAGVTPPAAIEEAASEIPGFDELPVISEEERFPREVEVVDASPAQVAIDAEQEEQFVDLSSPSEEAAVSLDVSVEQASVQLQDVEESASDWSEIEPANIASSEVVQEEVVPPWYVTEPVVNAVAESPQESPAAPFETSWGDLQPSPAAAEAVQIAEQSQEAEENSVTVLIDEQVHWPEGINGFAKEFSELSMGTEESSPAPEAIEETPEPSPEVAPQISATKRPVDPSVDTTALLREFSGLMDGGLDDGATPHAHDQISRTTSESADERRGLFGKKKR